MEDMGGMYIIAGPSVVWIVIVVSWLVYKKYKEDKK